MKTRFFIMAIFSFQTLLVCSQATYRWQNPLPQGGDIYGEFFINSQVGWMAGADGFILKTINGGVDWEIQNSNTLNSLRDLWFFDENRGWAVGNQNTILKTEDGGATWIQQPAPTFLDLFSIYFINADTGWIFGTYMTLLRTTDGGQSWQNISTGLPSAAWLEQGVFTDFDHGWAVGGDLDQTFGVLFSSNDGGVSWDTALTTSSYLNSITFPSTDTGYICGRNGLLKKTIDGGQTWVDCPTGLISSFVYIGFSDALNGIVLSGQMENNILLTNNGGTTWAATTIGPAFSRLNKVVAPDDSTYFICGFNGVMFKSDNNGQSWTELCTGSHASLYALCFTDNLNGWAGGFGFPSKLMHTTNGGSNWQEFIDPEVNVVGPIRSIAFANVNDGLIIGDYGPLLKTMNGGQTWDTVPRPAPGYVRKVDYFTPENPIAIGYYGEIQRSLDGGQNWFFVNSGCSSWLSNISIIDSVNAFISGYDPPLILSTHDQGISWTTISPGIGSKYTGIDFINTQEGWINAEGEVLHSSDAGLSWESFPTYLDDQLSGIHFFDASNGAGFSRYNYYSTTNGGESWLMESVPYGRRFNVAHFQSPNETWLAGVGGTILYRSDSIALTSNSNRYKQEQIKVFPNPTSGLINVYFVENPKINYPVLFKLTDLLGQVKQSILLESKQQLTQFYVDNQVEGLFIGSFETADHKFFFTKIYIHR